MSDKHDKIDLLIHEFQSISPTSEQSLRWYLAVQQKITKRRGFYQASLSLAAGLVIGLVIGGLLLKMNYPEPREDFSATLAMVSVKNLAGN